MAEKDSLIPPPTDVSRPALTIARIIDRLCRYPGEYHILVTVPDHRQRPWEIKVYRADSLGSFKIGRTS